MKTKIFRSISLIIISSFIFILPLFFCSCSISKTQKDWVETKSYTTKGDTPSKFIIENAPTVDTQTYMQCAACSSAYLLRFYGYEADGLKLYKNYPSKNKDGTINPAGFKEFFEKYEDLDAQFYTGSIDELKNAVSQGIPQIVLVRTTPTSNSLHYMPVVGYDKENIFLQDSIGGNRNSDDSRYNRQVSLEDFEQMRDTDIGYYNNLFISIVKK